MPRETAPPAPRPAGKRSVTRSEEPATGSHLGLPELEPDKVVQHTAQVQSGHSLLLERLTSLIVPHRSFERTVTSEMIAEDFPIQESAKRKKKPPSEERGL